MAGEQSDTANPLRLVRAAPLVLVLLAGLAWLVRPAVAADAEVLLTLTLPDGTERQLDRAALAAMPRTEIGTTTIWTDGPQAFGGVRLSAFLDRMGVEPARLTLAAANGYEITVETGALMPDAALLAIDRNGAPMSLRDKGPLWLVYDYDSDPRYRTEVVYSNSIWQLDRITITE